MEGGALQPQGCLISRVCMSSYQPKSECALTQRVVESKREACFHYRESYTHGKVQDIVRVTEILQGLRMIK